MDKALFLDKDGTLVEYINYGPDPKTSDVLKDNLMEDKILEGLKHAVDKGYKLIVVSNQPWVAKGVVTLEQTEQLFLDLKLKLKEKGIIIQDYFFCPHRSSDNCECKKPKAGMIFEAAKKHNIDLANSYMIGDSYKDVLAGKQAQTKTIFLTGGKSSLEETNPDFTINQLNDIRNIL